MAFIKILLPLVLVCALPFSVYGDFFAEVSYNYIVISGNDHACAIDDTGVVCWGYNGSGQTTVPALTNPKELSAGWRHTCAIDDTGVVCWGSNSYGQTTAPVLINPKQLSVGYSHSCALDDTGVVCWGRNWYGQASPPNLSNPSQVSAGGDDTCAIDDTGVVCWGEKSSSLQIYFSALTNPKQLSVGAGNTCAIDDTGVVCRDIGVPNLSNPSQVSAGSYHTCALDDMGVVCWVGISDDDTYGLTDVPTLIHPIQISAGSHYTCALTTTGPLGGTSNVHCWGRDDLGVTNVPNLLIPGLPFPNKFNPEITSPATFSAAENQTAIGTVIATDADGDSLTYSLSGTDVASISIHPSSGVLTFSSAPDYETKSFYSITVSVSDGMATTSQELTITITNVNEYSNHTLTLNYAGNPMKPINGVEIVLTESDGTVTKASTDSDTNQITITIPDTNTYTLSGSLSQTGEDPVDLLDAIWILQHMGELRTLTAEQLIAADVNRDGKVDLLDAIWILQHMGELRILDRSLVFLDATTGQPLSETTFNPEDIPKITVIRLGDVNQSFEPVKPWVQKGTDINGQIKSTAGQHMALSADGNRLAVVTRDVNSPDDIYPYPKKKNLNVFDWVDGAWIQRGFTMPVGDGNSNGSLSMTSDGNTIAVNIDNGFIVYEWNGSYWTEKGTLDPLSANPDTFGVYYHYLEICNDGNRVVTSSTPIEIGYCTSTVVFGFDDEHYISAIVLKPSALLPKSVTLHDLMGNSWERVFSITQPRCAVGSRCTWGASNLDNSSSKQVRNIDCRKTGTDSAPYWNGYTYVTAYWQTGSCSDASIILLDPDGNESILNFSTDKIINDFDDSTVESLAAVSSDGTRAILRVFDNNNDSSEGWQQRGSSIDDFEISSNTISSFLGTAVPNHFPLKLTKDSNNLAIGVTPNFHSGIDNDINNTFFGKVKIYNWNGSNWVQPGLEIDGISGDRAFRNIAFSEDGKTVAIGTLGRTDGIIRVYHLE